ncbi:MAG: long-chain fatty acid--CoA ligase [Actinobacteria bacterium]|nr:long-chain fatty acid--CoA ligase [Actinomycetota bacterium]
MAATMGDRIALQEKRYGIWQAENWAEFNGRVRAFAQGISTMGVGRGDVIAVLGDNRPEWLIAELGVQALGGMSVGIYPTSIGEEIVHIITHAGIRLIVAEDQEQVDKLIDLPSTIEKIIYYDPQGLELYDDPKLIEFTKVEELGRVFEAEHPDWIDEQIDLGSGEDTAVLCTTSGTTGLPKLAMLSHRNLLSMGRNLMEADPLDAEDRFVSFLPFAWVGEQMMALACGFQAGFTISFPEEAETVQSDMREIGPNVMFAPPRIWESMLSTVQVRIGEAGWLKKHVFSWGFDVGEEAADLLVRGEQLPPGLRYRLAIADVVALRPVRDQLGLTRIKRAYTGGAPLGPDVFRFFHSIGVNLKQIYGQTEICGIAVVHRDGDIKFNTVGTPIAGTEMRIADDGEILLRSPAVFQGYYRNPEATESALEADGWLHTGDAGFIDEDGQLVVIDRAKDVMHLPDGTAFSPAFIENKMKFSQFVEEAVTFGGDHPYIAAIITIDGQTVGAWAEREHLAYTTYTDLSQMDEVYTLVAEDIAKANQDLPPGARVRRFLILHKQFDPDDDEITRTRKVRRGTIATRYADLIEALYTPEREAVTITSTITYQDGTTVDREVRLRIFDMETFTPSGKRRRYAWSTGR